MPAVREVGKTVTARVRRLLTRAREALRRNKRLGEIELVEPLISLEEKREMGGDAGSRTIFTTLERIRHPCLMIPAVREYTNRDGKKRIESVETGEKTEAPTICMSAVEKKV